MIFGMSYPKPTPKTWSDAKAAYVKGEGTLAGIAEQFGLRLPTVEARSRKENWVTLRTNRESALEAQLIPSSPIAPFPPAEMPKQFTIDADFMAKEAAAHYVEIAALIRKVRSRADELLGPNPTPGLGPDSLHKLSGTISSVADATAKLLGLNQKGKQSKRGMRSIAPIGEESYIPIE
jgi:hypothetical protein